jgi:hypothetical protein
MAETVRIPDSGEELQDRRRRPDRREGDRRQEPGGRRAEDRSEQRRRHVIAAAWALCGGLVVLYLFFIALDAVDPTEARAASIVVLVLAVAWLAHAWHRLYTPCGHVSRSDRERRGF